MAQQWNVGDIVRVKSGGPSMTVEYVDRESDHVRCIWFDGSEAKTGSFAADALEQTIV